MMQDSATSETNYRRFVARVRGSGEVWGLRSDQGWATCASSERGGATVLVFWSDRAYAQRHVQGAWCDYKPTAIPLDGFIERWLTGMHADGMLVGPNWDAHLCGLEVEPREVAQDLSA